MDKKNLDLSCFLWGHGIYTETQRNKLIVIIMEGSQNRCPKKEKSGILEHQMLHNPQMFFKSGQIFIRPNRVSSKKTDFSCLIFHFLNTQFDAVKKIIYFFKKEDPTRSEKGAPDSLRMRTSSPQISRQCSSDPPGSAP